LGIFPNITIQVDRSCGQRAYSKIYFLADEWILLISLEEIV